MLMYLTKQLFGIKRILLVEDKCVVMDEWIKLVEETILSFWVARSLRKYSGTVYKSTRTDLHFHPECTMYQQDLQLAEVNKLTACLIAGVSLQTALLYVLMLHQKWSFLPLKTAV